MELKFAEDQGFRTTLYYVAFTDIKNMIGDAAAACSLTRNMEHPFLLRVPPLRAANICMTTYSVSRENRVDVGRIIANDQGIVRLLLCRLDGHGHLSSLVWRVPLVSQE